jgi:hypothetical protein
MLEHGDGAPSKNKDRKDKCRAGQSRTMRAFCDEAEYGSHGSDLAAGRQAAVALAAVPGEHVAVPELGPFCNKKVMAEREIGNKADEGSNSDGEASKEFHARPPERWVRSGSGRYFDIN